MKVKISYKESLTFEQFKTQFEQYFTSSKKEVELKKAWELAESKIKPKQEVVAEPKTVIETSILLDEDNFSSKRKYSK